VLCTMVHDRFGRDQHEALIRQLFHIRRLRSVAEYVEKFSTLVDQLAAYEADANPLYYTMHFVGGLRDDIKSMVMIQRSSTLDYACALAMVQEEAADSNKGKESRRYEPSSNRAVHGSAVALSVPPKFDKSLPATGVEDRRAIDGARATSADDKMRALRQYRRARGLCDCCAEKWVHDHKCAPTVQLQVIQEMWELFPDEEISTIASVDPDQLTDDSAHLCMCLSESAVRGVESPRSMRLMGNTQCHQIEILVDSGSSHTFLSVVIAEKLGGMSALSRTLLVQVADGKSVMCSSKIADAKWDIQGYGF
jgi:hypothetical protein